MDDSSPLPDIVFNGETYRDWHISYTAYPSHDKFLYNLTEPGQKNPKGLGLPFKTLDECSRAAKQVIDSEIEQKGDAGV
jgi:hypothetical protein